MAGKGAGEDLEKPGGALHAQLAQVRDVISPGGQQAHRHRHAVRIERGGQAVAREVVLHRAQKGVHVVRPRC